MTSRIEESSRASRSEACTRASMPTSSRLRWTEDDVHAFSLVMEETESLFDEVFADQPAQLANGRWMSRYKRWANVKTTLADIDTSELHFVKVPENLVVIDFDLKDLNGHKALERNLEAASQLACNLR